MYVVETIVSTDLTIAHFVKLRIKISGKSRQLANPICVVGLSCLTKCRSPVSIACRGSFGLEGIGKESTVGCRESINT